MSEENLVRFEKHGAIGVITVDNPPVNALSPGVPEGIIASVDAGVADPDVKAMVLIGAGPQLHRGRRYPPVRQRPPALKAQNL